MKKILGSIAGISSAVVLVAACSSSSGSSATIGDGGVIPTNDAGTTCTAVASGGTSETLACGLGAIFLNGVTELQLDSANDVDGLSIIIQLNGPPTATTYTAATVIGSVANFKSADKQSEWAEQAANGADLQGTFSLVITDPGVATDLGSNAGTSYASHGTFTGSFVQVGVGGGDMAIDGGAPATLSVTF